MYPEQYWSYKYYYNNQMADKIDCAKGILYKCTF